jgi:hypothetical protein
MKEIKGKTFKEAAANITRNLDSSKTYLVQLKNKSTNRSKKYILKGGLRDGSKLDEVVPEEVVPTISMNSLKINSINLRIIQAQEKKMREELNKEEVRKQLKKEIEKEIENITKNSNIKKRDLLLYNKLVDKLINIKFYIEEIKKLKNSANTSNNKKYKLGPLIELLKNLIIAHSSRSNVDNIFKDLFEKYKNEAELVIQEAIAVLSSLK